jgi:hypothetical protein
VQRVHAGRARGRNVSGSEGDCRADEAQRRNGRLQLEVNRMVSGTINGGGAEFEFRTVNANIYLRKSK